VRTLVATILVAAALAAALIGWFSAGWSGVRAREAELRAAPHRAAEAEARELADELVARLEQLRVDEARRPYFHYQSLFHDPRIASEGIAVAPSPLADGPGDPLVRGHFQVSGKAGAYAVTMPTINDDIPGLTSANFIADSELRRELVAVAPALVEAASGPIFAQPTLVAAAEASKRKRPRPASIGDDTPVSGAGTAATAGSGSAATVVASAGSAINPSSGSTKNPIRSPNEPQPQVIELSPDEYAQNAYSNNAYQQALENRRVIDPDELTQQQSQQQRRRPQQQSANPSQQQRVNPSQQQRVNPSQQATNPPAQAANPPAQQQLTPQMSDPAQSQSQQSRAPAPSQAPPQRIDPQSSAVEPAPSTTPTPAPSATTAPASTPARPRPRPRRRPKPAPPAAPERVTIAVSPMEWHEATIGEQSVLTALRRVDTPDGVLTQGLVLDETHLATWLADRHPGATLARGGTPTVGAAAADVSIGGWRIELPVEGLDGVAASVAAVRTAFWGRYIPVAALAALCGFMVVMVVARAERFARARSRFAAAAAHELRTPLAGLQLYGDMLADGLGDPRKAQQYAHRISEEASRLGRVVANVLGFSQLERGDLAVQPRDGDAAIAARDVVERARPTLERAKMTIEVDLPDSLPARFDPDALARILGNLLDNAEKYSRDAATRVVTLRGTRTADRVELSVTDTGPGVTSPARLFVPFSRGVGSDGPAGLGLGLALSRSLARAMHGDLSHTSGSTFTLSLSRTQV
jgi:signal transduction histidine kinase